MRQPIQMILDQYIRVTRLLSSMDWIAVLILSVLAAWLFRYQLLGDNVWIGNPDRLNGDLKYLKHYLFALEGWRTAAWDEFEMMGWDSFAMAGLYPNPLIYLLAAFGKNNLYVTMGYVAIAMLAASGIAAYAFIRADLPASIPALVGAICYEFSSLTLLKVSQNSMSVAVFIVIPLIALAIRRTGRQTMISCFLALTVLLACMLSMMFLQKAAYALMLTGAYAVWRSHIKRSWIPLVIFGAAFLVALLFAAPRIIGVAETVREYTRIVEGINLKSFEIYYKFQHIYPEQILRWFDYGIFGRTMSEGVSYGILLNLTEGFLIYTSAIVPFLLLTGLLYNRVRWTNLSGAPPCDAAFFFWFLVACILVIVFKPAAIAIFLLFLRMDFTHARILIVALLPLAYLVALTLTDLSQRAGDSKTNWGALIAGMLAGLSAALFIDIFAEHFTKTYVLGDLPPMRASSLLRIVMSVTIYLALLEVLLRRTSPLSFRGFTSFMICGLIASQCLISANAQVNGRHVFNDIRPFNFGDFYYARKSEFHLPSAEQLRVLHQRIEPDRYRVALVCDQDIAGGFCAGHVPEFWQLRAIDGYYGLGVPSRLRALPWPTGASMRSISFLNLESMPWDLLGFLNVRSVLVSDDGVYRNIERIGSKFKPEPDPLSFKIIPSPARVTPRVFFAAAAEPAASLNDAIKQIFRSAGITDPEKTSFVEGLDASRTFAAGGSIELKSKGDLLELRFSPAPTERLLVLNELYYPGWYAEIDGRKLPILATNAVMRGVLVPSGADHLNFHYVTRSATTGAWMLRLCAILAALGLLFAMWRLRKK